MLPFPSPLLMGQAAAGGGGWGGAVGVMDGALVTRGATAIAGNAMTDYATEVYDRGGFADLATHSTRLTLPASALYRVGAAQNSANPQRLSARKNGASFVGEFCVESNGAGGSPSSALSAIFSGSAADYLENQVSEAGTPSTANGNWFGVESLSAATKYAFATRITSSQSMPANTLIDCVFNNEVVDTDGFYDPATGLITVPAGVSRIRITTNIETASAANGVSVFIAKGDGTFIRGLGGSAEGNYTFSKFLNAASAVLQVTAGDTFKIQAISGSATSLSVTNHSWVCVEEVPDYQRILAYRSTSFSAPNSTPTTVPFDSAVYGSSLLNTTNGSIVVPSGPSEMRISYGWNGPDLGRATLWVALSSNLSARVAGTPHDTCAGFFNVTCGAGVWTPVSTGQEYVLRVNTITGGGTVAADVATWLCAEFR